MLQKIHNLGPHARQQLTQLNQINRIYQLQQRLYPSSSYQKQYQTRNSKQRLQIINPQQNENIRSKTPRNKQQESLHRTYQNNYNNTNSQMIMINDRKFIKNRTTENIRYNSPQNFNFNGKQEIDPWVKIRVLENRIVQLHRDKQIEMINLVNKNLQIQKQLQNQRQKSHILLNNTNPWTQTSKITKNQNNNQYPNIQIQTLHTIIEQLQQNLQKVTEQNKSLMNKNKNISEQIETFVKILITQKQIENQTLSNRSKYIQDKTVLESKIRQLDLENRSYKEQLEYMKKQLHHMRVQNIKLNEQYKYKQSQLQNIITKTQHQANNLHKKCIQLQEKLKLEQNRYTNLLQEVKQYRINAEIQKISLYRSPILINQVSDQSFLNINSNISEKQYPQQLTEDNLSNIIQKMQILTHNNDQIIQQNYQLRNKINQLAKDNSKLKNTQEFVNGKSQPLDIKIYENNLQRSHTSISNINQNTPKSMLQQKNFSLQLSATTLVPKKKEQNCTRCKELVQSLFRLRNQVGLKSCAEKKTW